ncbi:MAG TPA: nitroreductase family protein [Patescibacteria group bacterium]|nr:nitroreductase family protein [Patescibacteria group bacterium]
MKKKIFKYGLSGWLIAAALMLVFLPGWLAAAELQAIKLNPPDLKRGLPLMEALSVKASAREFSEKELSLQDLSDLLWAADGINRPAENKSTASSAMNAHDIRIYVFMKEGAYLYDAPKHELAPVLAGDYRSQLMMARPPRPAAPPAAAAPVAPPPPPPAPSNPPVQIILVSDGERFTRGDPERKFEWGALDAGIVSQNISLFCAATGLKTRPKASMDKAKIKELLKLADTQTIFLNHPVGYAK